MREKSGFSILELILVITFLLVLSGAMMPMVSTQLNKTHLNTAIGKLYFEIKDAQQLSLARENGYGYYGIKFFVTGYKIERYEPQVVTLPIPSIPQITIIKSWLEGDNPLILEQGLAFDRRITISGTSKIRVGDRIIFIPEGSITTNGQALLTNANNEITLACGTLSKKIVLSPITGYAQIQ